MAEGDQQQAKAWLRQQTKLGRAAARPAIGLGLLGILLAIGQAWCAASVLAAALAGATDNITWALAGFAVLALSRAAAGYASERASFAAGAAGRRRLRTEALTRLLHAPMRDLRNTHSGELTATVTDRVEALDGLFARWVPAAALAIAGPLLVLAAVAWADRIAALILLCAGLAVPVGMAVAGIGAGAAARGQFRAMARLQARFLDRVRGIATIVAHGAAEREAVALGVAADELRQRTMRVLRVAFLSGSVLDLAAAAAIILLALRYGTAWASGSLAAIPALFVLLLVAEFFAPLRAFALAYQDRLHATGAADALAALPEEPTPAPAQEVRSVAAQGLTVVFEDVSLTWDASRGKALDGVSFRVPSGETLVLTGPSGAGKSSVLEILLGFVRPDTGRVTINGADIADLVPAALSRLTAWVGQRPMLFAGSIRDNIRFARPEATDAEIDRAARLAGVEGFTAELPQGLDTPVGEGGYGLSGGQAQRVAVARAFLKDAPLLLLDEPTAHLDPATEADLLDSLRRLAAGRTVILASHAAAAHAFSGHRLDLAAGRVAAERGVA
jgi:ATP-binding cassette, subfamily C, bacterial CydD